MAKYLDEEGLRHLWAKIDGRFDNVEAAVSGIGYTLSYDENGKTIKLMNGENTVGSIDAAPFIKDGMLNDVEIVEASAQNPINGEEEGKFIKFTWNIMQWDSENGTEIVDEYKIDYIKVTDITVEPTTENTEISKDIKVAGGPLASLCAGAFEGGKIPADMSMQELLEVLFFSENWSSVSKVNGASNVGTDKFNVGMTLSASGVQKVGTTVTVNDPTVSQTNKAASAYVTGFDYSKYSLDGTTTKTCTTSTKVGETSWVYSSEEPSVSITSYAGFGLEANPAVGDTLTVAIGTNSVTATGVGVARTATCAQVGPIYDVSSEGNIANKDANIYTIEAQSKTVSAPANQTSTATVTGVYPIYTNANAAGNIAETTVEIIDNASVFEIEYGPETSHFHMFAYPASHTLSKVENFNPQSQQYGDYVGGSNTTDSSITVAGQAYKLWTRAGAANTEKTKYKFTLDKLTSQV